MSFSGTYHLFKYFLPLNTLIVYHLPVLGLQRKCSPYNCVGLTKGEKTKNSLICIKSLIIKLPWPFLTFNPNCKTFLTLSPLVLQADNCYEYD